MDNYLPRHSKYVEWLLAPQILIVWVPWHREHSLLGGVLLLSSSPVSSGASCIVTLLIAATKCLGNLGGGEWRKHHVQSQPECIVEHARYQVSQELVALLEAGVRVDLDQPGTHGCVNHEIVAENLHAELPIVLVNLLSNAHQGRLNDWHHFFFVHFVEVDIDVILVFQKLLTLLKRKDITFLILPVISAMLLDSVVGQMDEHVVNLVQIVWLARHPDIALLEIEAFVLWCH